MKMSLYIHVPWCVRKCPYCDFNSHTAGSEIPEASYIDALIKELEQKLSLVTNRCIDTIFIGGGTPSLFTPDAYALLFKTIKKHLSFSNNIEITLEANPGTVEQARFQGFYEAGINRLSLGVQSLQDDKLKSLGRIHNSQQAIKAVNAAQKAGFKRINMDLMFALPNQSIEDACSDLQTAIDLQPSHLSWYHLTIEPNTYFFHSPPKLPNQDIIWDMQTAGQQLLAQAGFHQYEISAYCQDNDVCRHNLNYWQFGDYLGIGAGAHSKLTDPDTGEVSRHWNVKNPRDYLDPEKDFIANKKILSKKELSLEFMMNALRLTTPTPIALFEQATGLSIIDIEKELQAAQERELLTVSDGHFIVTPQGRNFLNELLELFL